jgi:hypothetical protein
MNRGVLNEKKINKLARRLNCQQEALTQCSSEMRLVRDNISWYFELQSVDSAMMAEIMSSISTIQNTPNFT